MEKFRKVFKAIKKACTSREGRGGYWVRGSGLVHVPNGQLNQIPKVIREHHDRELQIEKLRLLIRRA